MENNTKIIDMLEKFYTADEISGGKVLYTADPSGVTFGTEAELLGQLLGGMSACAHYYTYSPEGWASEGVGDRWQDHYLVLREKELPTWTVTYSYDGRVSAEEDRAMCEVLRSEGLTADSGGWSIEGLSERAADELVCRLVDASPVGSEPDVRAIEDDE